MTSRCLGTREPPDGGTVPTVVIIGVSGGLGRGLAEEHRRRGWDVIGTVRKASELDDLGTEVLDTTDETGLDDLAARLPEVDRLVVAAGVAGPDAPVGQVAADDFTQTMLVNTLAPLRVVDRLADQIAASGSVVVLTSDRGSVASADSGGDSDSGAQSGSGGAETYRISKAGLNIGLRAIAARRHDSLAYLAVYPGWVDTDMGGQDAQLSVADASRQVTDVIETCAKRIGSWFVDHEGRLLPW